MAEVEAQLADLQEQFALLLTANRGQITSEYSIWEDTGVSCTDPVYTDLGFNDGWWTIEYCNFDEVPGHSDGSWPSEAPEPQGFTIITAPIPLSIVVTVNLLSASGDVVDSTTANGYGEFTFTDVEPLRDYMVEFVAPDGWTFTIPGGDMTVDPITGRTAPFTMPLNGNIQNPGVVGFVPIP